MMGERGYRGIEISNILFNHHISGFIKVPGHRYQLMFYTPTHRLTNAKISADFRIYFINYVSL